MGKEVTKSAEFRSFCPVATSLDLLGDKWTLLILRDMIWAHKTMFKEFKESPEKMPSKMLSNRLKKLEGLGFISKNKGEKNNKNIYYFLEPRGIDVFPIMIELSIFSTKHFFDHLGPAQVKEVRTKALKDKTGYTKELILNYKQFVRSVSI